MNITMVRGDDKLFELTFTKGGTALDISGWTIYFTVKDRLALEDAEAILARDITVHSDPTHGKTQLTITHDESEGLPDMALYDIRSKDGEGQITTLLIGRIYAINSITQRIP